MIQIVLLRNGHAHPIGFPSGLSVSNSNSVFENLGLILEKLRAQDPDNLKNVYYTVAHHLGAGGAEPNRNEKSFEYQTLLPFDIDYVDSSKAWEYLPLVAKILGAAPQSLILVSTGNGLHIIAQLKTPVRSGKYFKETKPYYNEIVYKINAALKDAGLPGQADPSIWEPARILRLPNTVNESAKKGTKEATLLQYPGLVPLDLDIEKISGLDKAAQENITPAQLKKNYPRPDFQEVMHECEFMKWLVAKPDEVHEPQFMSAVGLLGAMAPGDKADALGKENTPKELAEAVYSAACNSKSLQTGDFERKWEHGTRYGAPKCSTISQNWIGGCERCPHHHKINTPLALKSEAHIASSANGFWVMGKNGPQHPHYSDLSKIYRQQHSYIVCEPDRIFTFEQTHYKPTGQLTVKAWLEKTASYEEYIRESHRVEFVKKVLCSGAISDQQAENLFEQTVRGKLNCANGVIDVVRGELLPHSPNYGFKYVLPYDYKDGEVSEFFLDWLAEMMMNRTELMDSVLDMMAYCLWPSYDDHVFCYLIGEGANGKGTLIHVLQHLLGVQNYSTISLSQLGGNRFAPANLEGKLANVSEEASGTELSFEELNVIKDLSAGGEIQVEHKGQHPFNLKNRAKMIFSANKTPRFKEQGVAIRRRLLVVPFDYLIENKDSRIEDRLRQEVPKICSMLVRRIQENLRVNGGRFIVSRGGQAAQEAQDRVLLAGNSVVEWGKENLESSLSVPDSKYITCQEAYANYVIWCEQNHFKAMNSKQFGYTMTHGVLTSAIKESKTIKIGGKATRVYPHTCWREEALV